MALTSAQLRQAWRDCLDYSPLGTKFSKDDLAAAAAAVDSWIDTNAASFNLALPLTFRTNATAAEKALLFMAVASRRYLG